jgi:hypothetical protein
VTIPTLDGIPDIAGLRRSTILTADDQPCLERYHLGLAGADAWTLFVTGLSNAAGGSTPTRAGSTGGPGPTPATTPASTTTTPPSSAT